MSSTADERVTVEQTDLVPGWYIGFVDAVLNQWYWWDVDQGSFHRGAYFATRFETKEEAEDTLAARDMPSWIPRAKVVEVV